MNYRKESFPDFVYPSTNSLEIPDLPLSACAKDLPRGVIRWGRLNRSSLRHARAIHFYTDDRKFGSLCSDPGLLLGTDCSHVIEVNFSLGPQTPLPWAIWKTYQKRVFSCFWASRGVKIIVDLSVHSKFCDLNLRGVPLGWSAFACRGYQGFEVEDILYLHDLALTWSGRDRILFIVYGGGKPIQAACTREGFIYLPEDSHVYEKRKTHGV